MPGNTEQRQNSCPAWIWLVLLLGLVLLFLLYQHATSSKAEWIQEDIQNRVSQNLQKETALSQVNVLTDGRDIILSGNVSSEAELEKAEQIARQTIGTRLVTNELNISNTLSDTPQVEVEPMVSTNEDTEEASGATPIPKAKVEPLPDEFAPLEEESTPSAEEIKVAETAVIEEKLSQLDFSSITFEKNSSALTDSAKNTLDVAASTLLENPSVNIRIEGHTDTSGNSDHNLKLSKQRAQSVLNYFVDAGIDGSRLEANGFGDQFPIAPNDTQAGRIKNRRIEIKVKNGE